MSDRIIRAALKCGKGCVRDNNEDAFYFNGRFAPLERMNDETTLTESFPEGLLLFAVCDGMGGYDKGEVASHMVASRMDRLRDSLSRMDFHSAVDQWITAANQAVFSEVNGSGSTLALLYIANGAVQAANVGDSRIYRWHNGKLTRMSRDHSKVQILIDAGIIKPEEAFTHPQRHVITRFLGMDEHEAGRCSAYFADPVSMVGRDRYLICSDGVTDMLTEERIEKYIAEEKDFSVCAENIYQAALSAGGKDNTTLILLEFDWDGGEEILADIQDCGIDFEDTLPRGQHAERTALPTFTVEHNYSVNKGTGRITILSRIVGQF